MTSFQAFQTQWKLVQTLIQRVEHLQVVEQAHDLEVFGCGKICVKVLSKDNNFG